MTPFAVTLMFTAGAATWIYTKLQKYSGNNTQQSVIATGVAALFIFIVFYFIASSFVK
jgi:low affinity Fe/Cu permease